MKRFPIALLALFSAVSHLSAEEDWTYLFKDAAHVDFYFEFLEETEPEEVFKFIDNGTLRIEGKGKSIGYIQTLDEYENYEIETEWRWPDKPGNSGIQLHCDTMPYYSIWPTCIEVQMANTNVGDFWLLGRKLEVEKDQMPKKAAERDRRKKLLNAEKKPGQWNSMRIVVKSKLISVYLNGKLVNKGKNPSATSGYISIQAEDSNLEFRNFRIREVEDDSEEDDDDV